ncbi:hypothetical protein [Shewanella aestuarii]|uniref:Uncharacterized protein n=1 Tax=Shewanella aestuarii TaxID=1028752 RepID=A0A6G9QQD2_9GAMM|nr:hypothetical protein [Shewanella aestuarii]QIR16628.1 hypothetical protein HBH39_19320 [Shewanella aestuarii]
MLTILSTATNINDSVCDSPDSLFVSLSNATIDKIKALSQLLIETDAERIVLALSGDYSWSYDLMSDHPDETDSILHDLSVAKEFVSENEQPTTYDRLHVYKDKFRFTCIEKYSEEAFEVRTPMFKLDVLDLPDGTYINNIE